jgi:hypothetical protein
MSARTDQSTGSLQQVTVEARQTRLSLSPNSVVIHKNGIEFRSAAPFAAWTEMTMTLQSAGLGGRFHCNGVVIACTGNKHTGYHVSMVFTGLSKHAQACLSTMAQLG